ncbi:Uroporphyrinogen decarboxylase [Caldithrix abyssi DSM 13497]|uniref:Uroporphyrinogen decarboxylase n=1 Tax=Caldithrix abyssi DSM 13497 TaxID=880073 RepID=H1XPE6_CALAY|nr:uroporphyrinogen decarboxylase [Caldithrix abyssi]APF19424.1 hemE uroporphyrinogen decarboxylase [Caldithrix abyssi DSM 13497]EHO43317.1 Uroporphyrinogen decarboxylase [Caldithrix abyssi DSM 13497]
MSENNLFLKAIHKKPVERTPVWIMRQAGRYLPEYRALRDKYDFLTVCKTPELAAEVTLQPIKRFGFDAAILFSDILVVPEAMGQTLEFMPDHGPKLTPPIRSAEQVERLTTAEIVDKLQYVAQAIKVIRNELDENTALIGFSGSPFTLAAYMIEGKPTRHFKHIKGMMYREPQILEALLQKLTEAIVEYLQMQIQAGVQAVQVFDTWGSVLPLHLYEPFSARYMKEIAYKLQKNGVPVILFGMGGIDHLIQLGDSLAQALGVEWQTDMEQAIRLLHPEYALQGNLDPTVLYGSKETITREVERILKIFGKQNGHIFNLGHGIHPDVPLENVEHLVQEVRRISAELRKADD